MVRRMLLDFSLRATEQPSLGYDLLPFVYVHVSFCVSGQAARPCVWAFSVPLGSERRATVGLLPWTSDGALQPVGEHLAAAGLGAGGSLGISVRGFGQDDGHIPVGVRF